MVNDIFEELLDLDMEPKPDSLWWTSTYKDELRVGSRGRTWALPLSAVFHVLGCRFHRDGKGISRRRTDVVQRYGQLVAGQVHLSLKGCARAGKCRSVLSHVCSTALNGSISWPWSGATLNKVRAWEAKILRLTFRARMIPSESLVNYTIRTAKSLRIKWKRMDLPLLNEKIVDKIWTTMNWAIHDGDVPIMKVLRSILGRRTTTWWRNRSARGMATDPTNITRWKYKFGFHNRGIQWNTPMSVSG